MTRGSELPAIVAGLSARAEVLARELLPHGHRSGHEWSCAGKDSPFGCSVSVHLGGGRAGVWSAWAIGEKGDALDLVAAVLFNKDKGKALHWARSWLGLDGGDPERFQKLERERQRQVAAGADQAERRRKAAKALWLEAEIELRGTPAATYLLARGIDFDRLGRQPRALRFHPALADGPPRQAGTRRWPALVAGITRWSPQGSEQVAIHRTYLLPDGSGKAPIVDEHGDPAAKRTLGVYRGGLIPLWRGASGKPLKDAPDGDSIVIGEGIEDTLSAALARPALRCAAAVSLSNMGSIALPPAIATVIILAQNDPWFSDKAGPSGKSGPHGAQIGLDRVIRHFQDEGRKVRLARPPAGKDINDLLRGAAA